MKNIFKVCLCFLLSAAMLCGGAYAADDTKVNTAWEGDYATMDLVVTITTLAPYTQQYTVVMYPAGGSDPGVGGYTRMADVTVPANGSADVRIRISDSCTAPGGAYKVVVQGNGYLSGNCRKEINVFVLTPSQINGVSGILNRINTATASDVTIPLSEAASALDILVTGSESMIKRNTMINIRTTDYNGNFPTLDNVRDAWCVADIIDYLLSGSVDTSTLESKIARCISLLGINTSDADFIAHKSSIYAVLPHTASSVGASNISSLKTAYAQAKALATVNNSSIDDMDDVISRYYTDLTISNDLYSKYSVLSLSDQQKVLRQLVSKNFTNVSDVVTAFSDGIKGATATNVVPNYTPSYGGGGGVGGFSAGGSKDDSQTNLAPNQRFGDCPQSYWAYPYINTLAYEGIVAGYGDGNFYPNNLVTREEFIKMIVLAAKLQAENPNCNFSDVDVNAWYYQYIAIANSMNIIMGDGNGEIGIGDNILRQDAAVIAYRILCMLGVVDESNGIPELGFSDADSVSDYAVNGVYALKEMKIINGFEDGSFKPQNYITRAEAAKIICLLMQLV